MEVTLSHGSNGEPKPARVTKRQKGSDGLPVGKAHNNPLLDTRVYTVRYTDGCKATMMANQIAENLFAQVDNDGY